MNALSKLPNATIYLEAGASDWEPRSARPSSWAIGMDEGARVHAERDPPRLDEANILHGLDISRRVGGKQFIINTSYNGRGPVHYKPQPTACINVWCHPGLRGLGPAPTTANTRTPGWTPTCGSTAPATRPERATAAPHRWAPGGARALMYAKYATDWLSPPRGTRFGFHKRISLRTLGGP